MLAIRLDDELIEAIDILAKTEHSNRSVIIRKAIIRYIEDNEDIKLALQAKKSMKSSKKLSKLRKELELDS